MEYSPEDALEMIGDVIRAVTSNDRDERRRVLELSERFGAREQVENLFDMIDPLGGDGVVFEGTPSEIVAFTQSHFSIMESIVRGVEQSCEEAGNIDDADHWRSVIDILRKLVYRIRVTPVSGVVANVETRPEYLPRVTRLQTALEIYDMLLAEAKKGDNDDAS